MTREDIVQSRLTQREIDALQALMDQRDVYRATGHAVAAKALGVAIWLVWQVFRRAPQPQQR